MAERDVAAGVAAILITGALIAACGTSVPEPPAGAPQADAAVPGPTSGEAPATPEADAAPSCDCPSHCASVTTPGLLVCKPGAAPATLPASQTVGKFLIAGYEYWQWKKKDPYDGGNAVAWGYNGDGEPQTGVLPTAPSRACMAESRKVLETLLATDVPAELEELRAQKGVKKFWNWNNDLTDAPAGRKISAQNDALWLYAGDRGDGGLIKWISATERDGTCRLPTRADLVLFAKACLTTFPKCGSGK